MCPPGGDNLRPHPRGANSGHLETHPLLSRRYTFELPTTGGHIGPPLRTEGEGLQGRESSGGLAACGAEWPRPFPTSRTILLFRRRGGPNANRLRAKHSKGKKGTPKIVNVHNLCLPKLCHITMANVFLVFSFLLFCPALVQNVPVVWEPDAQTMFSESCLGAIDARMGCPRQSQQLNGLSTLPI